MKATSAVIAMVGAAVIGLAPPVGFGMMAAGFMLFVAARMTE